MKLNKSQLKTIKSHLTKIGFITAWTAISKYNITRLSAHINALRNDGIEITSTRIYPADKNKNWYTTYTLDK